MASSAVKTYNSREVTVSIGTHAVSGLADDSFLQIEALGEGIASQTGCDGEVGRAIDPNTQYSVKLALLQTSDSNKYLYDSYVNDRTNGSGLFPLLIKDLKGNFLFSADAAWVTKAPSMQWGKGLGNREWEIQTGPADISFGLYQ